MTHARWVASALFILLGLAIGRWSAGGDQLLFVNLSPDGAARAEFRAPDRAHRLWLLATTGAGGDMPGTVRITNMASMEAGPASPAVELSGIGTTEWTAREVRIGTTLSYDRAAQAWTVTE